jgi:hypothetical protein
VLLELLSQVVLALMPLELLAFQPGLSLAALPRRQSRILSGLCHLMLKLFLFIRKFNLHLR